MLDEKDIKFIKNQEKFGIDIDWDLVFKEYKKLNIPNEYYNPTKLPLDKSAYHLLLSERKVGKTTNVLLLGLCIYKLYGLEMIYARASEDMIMPKFCSELFAIINSYENGKYIKLLTDDKYNNIAIHNRVAYYQKVSKSGEILEKSSEVICRFISIDRGQLYKSGFNTLSCWIIFDEFISKYYRVNEFVDWLDILSTIVRNRLNAKIIMLSNTIDYNSTYFREFEISKEVKQLQKGQKALIRSKKGTPVYVEVIDPNLNAKQKDDKAELNMMYFNFDNPGLAAITGTDEVWAFEACQHIWKKDHIDYLDRRLRLDSNDVLVQLEIVKDPDVGICVYAHPTTFVYEDSIILTCGEIRDKKHVFGMGHSKYTKFIWNLYDRNLFYYDTNETASLVDNFIKTYIQVSR